MVPGRGDSWRVGGVVSGGYHVAHASEAQALRGVKQEGEEEAAVIGALEAADEATGPERGREGALVNINICCIFVLTTSSKECVSDMNLAISCNYSLTTIFLFLVSRCSALGNPKPIITWRRIDGNPLRIILKDGSTRKGSY